MPKQTTAITRFTTYHLQRDGRIYLGRAVHRNPLCPALADRPVYIIAGEIAGVLPKCKRCHPEQRRKALHQS